MTSKAKTNLNVHQEHIKSLENTLQKISLGGGSDKLAKEKAKGKMTARERIAYLLDEKSEYIEIGALTAMDMYEAEGGCPSAGVVVVIGFIKEGNA